MQREQGGKRPLLVYVYSSSHNEDCCAANFERAVFRYDRLVDYSKRFECVKLECSGTSPLYKKYSLIKKKPAILLLDAEGGLIHKQQKCADPRKYLRVVKSAEALNKKRIDLRTKYVAQRQKVRDQIDGKEYSKALKGIDKVLKKRDLLLGDLQDMLDQDLNEIEAIGNEMFDRAVGLREKKDYYEALDLFREIEKEFAKLDSLRKKATSHAKETVKKMRAEGLPIR